MFDITLRQTLIAFNFEISVAQTGAINNLGKAINNLGIAHSAIK